MKKLLLSLSVFALLTACGDKAEDKTEDKKGTEEHADHDGEHDHEGHEHEGEELEGNEFGPNFESIVEEEAITVTDLVSGMEGATEMEATVTAEIKEVCQQAGCWMMISDGEQDIRVIFKDHFGIPKGSAGRTAVFHGQAYLDTVPVDMLQHFAEDAGASQEEIDAITEPSIEIGFEADGIILK